MVKAAEITKKAKKRSTRNALPPSLTLLTDMNDDCLVHVFECLDIVSLIKVCKSNRRFKEIVFNRVIPFKMVDFATFSKWYPVRKVFEFFGKSMTRMAINESDIQMTAVVADSLKFNELLRLLVEYGEPGRLQQVKLTFGKQHNEWWRHDVADGELLKAVGPYFKNVHSLSFNTSGYSRIFNQFMAAIPKQNLRSLNVENLTDVGKWLTAESLPHLQIIHVGFSRPQPMTFDRSEQTRAINESKIIAFISSKPSSLVDFDFVGVSHELIYHELSRSLPHIERLGKILCWEDKRAENRVNNNNHGIVRHQSYDNKWKYLNAFTKLKCLKLQSRTSDCSDCGEVFRILASRNTIEELDLELGIDAVKQKSNPVSVADIKRLDKLTTLHLKLRRGNDTTCNVFLIKLLANLPVLTKCTLKGFRAKQRQIIDLVQSVRSLCVLVVDCVIVFSASFYKTLLKSRKASYPNPEENRLIIYIEHEKLANCIDELGKKYKPAIISLKSL